MISTEDLRFFVTLAQDLLGEHARRKYSIVDRSFKPQFTGEELQVKFLPDSEENALSY